MGKPIVYCGDCGTSLREQDFEKGRAHEIDRRPYCSDCRPAPLPSSTPPPGPARISTARIPRVGTSRRRTASPASMAPFAAGGAALAAVVGLVVLLSSSSPSSPAPAAPTALGAPSPPFVPAAPPPVPSAPPPPTEESATPPAFDPSLAVDRWMEDVRAIRLRDPEFKRAGEIRALLRQAADIAGPRRAEVEATLADYEKAAAAPPPALAPEPSRPTAKAPRVTATYTLIDAETDKPVPGFDPLPEGAVVDLGRLGLRTIDVRINLSGKVGSLRTVINGGRPHVENGAPWSFTNNSVAGGFTGWKPRPGLQTLTVTPFSETRAGGEAGATLTFTFTVAGEASK